MRIPLQVGARRCDGDGHPSHHFPFGAVLTAALFLFSFQIRFVVGTVVSIVVIMSGFVRRNRMTQNTDRKNSGRKSENHRDLPSSTVEHVSIDDPPQDLDALIEQYDDVRALFAGEWMRYRTSQILPRLTAQTQATCARINSIYFDDTAEAVRLFQRLVPGAGSGVDFRPPVSLDYGIGLTIGEGTFLNWWLPHHRRRARHHRQALPSSARAVPSTHPTMPSPLCRAARHGSARAPSPSATTFVARSPSAQVCISDNSVIGGFRGGEGYPGERGRRGKPMPCGQTDP